MKDLFIHFRRKIFLPFGNGQSPSVVTWSCSQDSVVQFSPLWYLLLSRSVLYSKFSCPKILIQVPYVPNVHVLVDSVVLESHLFLWFLSQRSVKVLSSGPVFPCPFSWRLISSCPFFSSEFSSPCPFSLQCSVVLCPFFSSRFSSPCPFISNV